MAYHRAGKEAPLFCQFCGAQIPEGDQFCGQCGARTPVAPGAPPPAAPTGATAEGARPGDPLPAFGARDPQAQQPWRSAYFDRDPNAPSMAQQYEYAGFWIRFGAWLLDLIFAGLLALIPSIIFAVIAYALVDAAQEPVLPGFEQDQQENDRILGAVIGFVIPYVVISYAYQYIATSLGGGWGKRICDLRIVKQETGERPGYGTGAVRCVVAFLIGAAGNIPLIGWVASLLNYLWCIWDEDKQTWHDKAAGTVVVRV